ncbi:MAG: Fe-S cluster assembly protein SufD [Ahrensia sp.]|nr:Fe-S cluster assembly protein SufD [Ahrensia sp.]
MNAHTTKLLTEAETSLIEVAKALPQSQERVAAQEALAANGLPTRRVEAFHYTDLRALLKGEYALAERPSEEDALAIGNRFPRLVSDAAVLHFRSGHYFDRGEVLPDGVTVRAELPKAAKVSTAAASTVALNNALVRDGLTVQVAAGAKVDRTVGIAHAHSAGENTVGATRCAIEVGAGAECSLVDRSVGPDRVSYLSSQIVSLDIAVGSTVNYTLSNEEGDAAKRLARLAVTLGKDATLNLFILNVGGVLVRQEIDFDVTGEGATLNISGVNLVGGDAHVDVTSRITHHVPSTNATETFRNVATGRGQGVFQGQINVRQAAQLTDARMACNSLLLSDECGFSAKPELEIFADDVQCAHGATVTDLEESYLFYLRARGISEPRARQMLIKAFVAEVVEEMEHTDLIEPLEARIEAWMDRHV